MKQHKAQCFLCSPYSSSFHSKIEKEILRNEFTKDSTWGFKMLSRRSSYFQAVYVEKLIYTEKTVDPFGVDTEIERVSYDQIEFQVNIYKPNILIFQPPRNYRKLINQLAQFVDYAIAIETKDIKVFDWIDLLVANGINGIVTKINVDQICYDKATTGKLTLISVNDVRERFHQILQKTNYFVKNAKISFDEKVNLPEVEIFSNGKIVFKSPVAVENFKPFYDAFFEVTERQQ